MLNKKQIKFLKYVSKPRKRLDALKKFPKCSENSSLHDLSFSKYFDRLPGDMLQINENGRCELKKHPVLSNLEKIILFICSVICAVFAVLSYL